MHDLVSQDVWLAWTARWADEDWDGKISVQHDAQQQQQDQDEDEEATSFEAEAEAEAKKAVKEDDEDHGGNAATETATADAVECESAHADATTLVTTPYSPEVDMRDAEEGEEYWQRRRWHPEQHLEQKQLHAGMDMEVGTEIDMGMGWGWELGWRVSCKSIMS